MNLPRFALRRQAIVLAATAVAVLWGTLTFLTMPRREDPEFKIRTCIITASWPGATAEKVEQLVTDPIEKAASSIDEVDKVRSTSRTGYCTVYVDLDETVTDVDAIWDQVRAKVDTVLPSLPEGCSKPNVNSDFGDTAAMMLALYQVPPPDREADAESWRMTPRELEVEAERIKDEIERLDSVAGVALVGVRKEVIYLEVDSGRWSQLDMTLSRLRDLLAARNIVAPGGIIETERGRFGVLPTGELNAVEDIEGIIVARDESGLPVYLRDLGIRVVRDYEDPPRRLTRYRDPALGRSVECVVITFTMKAGRNIVVLGGEVRGLLDVLRATVIPAGLEVAVLSDQPRIVDDKIREFTGNLGQAVLIVVGVAFFLIGLRVAIVIAAAIPLTMLASIGISRFFGIQLEQMSIASLIIALGLLVDNAIEVVDTVLHLMHKGYSRFRAAAEGAGQIAFPILIATLTTVAAFLPMLTIPGNSGEYIRSLPVVLSVTLLVSWLLAMTFTTLTTYWLVRPPKEGRSGASPAGLLCSALRRLLVRRGTADAAPTSAGSGIYPALAGFCLRRKLPVIGIALLLFVGAVGLLATGQVGTQFFPGALRDQFLVDIHLPEGTPIHVTEEVCAEVEGIIQEKSPAEVEGRSVERLSSLISFVGEGAPRFYLSLSPEPPASGFAQILVNTTDPWVVEGYIEDIRRTAAERIPGARVLPVKLSMGPPIQYPVTLRIQGDDEATLRGIADRVNDVLRATPGTYDVHDSWGAPGYQVLVETDEEKAKRAGVTNAAIAQSLNAFFSGHYLTTYREGDHQVPAYLRLPVGERTTLEGIDSLYVEGVGGRVPLNAVARIEPTWVTAKIERHEKVRTIEARARIAEGLLSNTVLAEALPRIEEIRKELPPGYRIELGGEKEKTEETAGHMAFSFQITILLIVMCLVVKYNAFSKPILILVTLPLATIGSFLGLWITGQPLGFMSQLGLLSLAGVVVNIAIVLIEFVEKAIEENLEKGEGVAAPGERSFSGLTREAFRECVIRGSRVRITPIFLTTLTTVGGLIPLALHGGPLWEPMAVTIIFGLLLSTVLALLVLPAMICLLVEVFRVNLVPRAPEEEAVS
ncbi:MAG: efflux RND transporter permease subunit [Planctomycetota bacterium]